MRPFEYRQIKFAEHAHEFQRSGAHELNTWTNANDQFFLVNERLYFVDLPGYGFAKVAKEVRKHWGPMIESYLTHRPQLKLTVMLVDSRMPPTESDVLMKNWLDHNKIPNAVVLTKTDKISRSQLQKALQTSAKTLNTKEIIPFSAVTVLGKNHILSKVAAAI